VGLKHLGVFRVNCRRRGRFSAGALSVLSACEQTAAVCRENADGVYFSPVLAGSGGLKGKGQPSQAQLQSREAEDYLRSPPFPPSAAWCQPAKKEERRVGHQSEELWANESIPQGLGACLGQ
jgi:hypothetical protein